jgi:hypothetical protein
MTTTTPKKVSVSYDLFKLNKEFIPNLGPFQRCSFASGIDPGGALTGKLVSVLGGLRADKTCQVKLLKNVTNILATFSV